MKKLVAVVVVLLLVLVVAPWGVGRLAEKQMNAGLDQLVKEVPYLKVVDKKWTGGWFRAEQEVTFEVFVDMFRAMQALEKTDNKPAPAIEADIVEPVEEAPPTGKRAKLTRAQAAAVQKEAEAADAAAAQKAAEEAAAKAAAEAAKPPEPIRFTVRNEILHGPVLWTAGFGLAKVNTRLVLADDVRKKIAEFFGTDEPVHITSRVGFFGGGSTRFWGEGHKVKLKDGEGTLAYDDYKLDIGYSSMFDSLDYDGQWPRFMIDDPSANTSMLVENMSLTGKSKRARGDLYNGNFRFAIDKMSITDPDKNITSIEGIHYIGDSKIQDEFVAMSLKLGSGKVVNKALKELKLDLNEVHYDFTLRRLHAETLEKLVSSMRDMYTKPMATPEDIEVNFMKPFKEQGLVLLSHDPEFVIDRLGIVTPEGECVLKGLIKLKGLTAEDFASQAAWLAKIEADMTLEAAQKLLEKLPNGGAGAGMAVDQGFAKREGDKLVSHIVFKESRVTVNGKDVPIPGLGGGPTQAPPPGS